MSLASLPQPAPRAATVRLAVVGVFVASLLAACGDGGTKPVAVASVTVTTPPAPTIIAGTTHQLAASTLDAGGTPLTGRTIAWSTANGAVATVSASGMLAALTPGTVQISATSEGRIGTATIVVLPVPVATVNVTPPAPSTLEGTTVQLSASALSASGAMLTGRAFSWSSSNAAVATVDATGLVTALAAGTATILVTSEGVTGVATITVTRVPVASVTVAPLTAELTTGQTRQFTATLRDAAGNVLNGRTVVWTTNNGAVATIDAGTGLLTARGAGTAVVTALSEDRVGTAAVTVTVAIGPTITTIAPARLVPGASATITGVGFNAQLAAGNVVTIGGGIATVLSSTETQLVVTVPCVNSGDVPVRASRDGTPGPVVLHPLDVTQRPLGVGESVVLTSNVASHCNEIPTAPGAARYLVTVFSAGLAPAATVTFELGGNVVAPPSATPLLRHASNLLAPSASQGMDPELASRDAAHWRMLERNRADYARLRALAAAMPPQVRTQREPTPLPALGDVRRLFNTFATGCGGDSTVARLRARAIYVGTRAIIWEDTANVLQSSANPTLAANYQRMGQVYDRDQHETIRKYFADPLVRDDVTDDDDRVHMVFTQKLNGTPAAAYVTSCDQFSPTVPTNALSNFGQFFYGTVPTVATLNPNSTASPDGWFAFMSRTVVHEVKHIASLSARLANNAPFEQSWLEEGSARMAEEMWVRDSLHRTPWKSNTGWGSAATNGLYCDFHLTDATCNALDPLRRPTWGMRRQFNEIRPKLREPWNYSPYGDAGSQGAVFYNTTWSLLRYAIDRYGTSEEAFLRAFTNSNLTGIANLTAVAGTTRDQLIGGWGMALYADDYPGMPTTNADLQFRTWNLRSIYAGLNASPSWSGTWSTPFPIEPVALPFGSFLVTGPAVRGGAHAYYELSGAPSGPQLVRLQSVGNGLPAADVRVAIARLQ